jgi:nucleoside phosphorylase
MNLANRFLRPTDCFLVAFDIVSSSQNLANPNGLARDRRALFEAINQTALVRQCTRSESLVGQFLGDEFRLAFPTTYNGVAINASAVVEFIDDVFRKLENPTLGYAPVIRAALTNSPIRSMELRKFCYLSGGIALSQLSLLLGAIDGKNNLLITNLGLPGFQQVSDRENGSLYTKSYTHRDVPSPYTGPVDHDLNSFVVIAITNEHRVVDQTLLDFADACLEGFQPARISISPSSILFVFKEASFLKSKDFLASIRNQATVYRDGLQIAAAIAYGLGREIEEKDWLPQTFESGTAIQVCRLLAKLPPGALAIPADPAQLELFSPLSRQLKDKLEIPGKREEVFKCVIDRSYFPKKDPPPPQPPPQDRYAPADFKKQCQALFIAKQWPELLDLLDQRTTQLGSTRRATNLQGAVVIFKSDYESIRSQSRDGFVSAVEEQRLLVALWSRVLMLIDDIDGTPSVVIEKKHREITAKSNQSRSPDSNDSLKGNGVVTSIEFTLDRPFHEFDESAFKSAFRQCTGIDAKKIRIASIRPGSTIVRVEGDPDVLQRVVEQFVESKEKLHLFCQLTGFTSLQWAINGRSYKLDVLQANELTPMTRNTNTDDKDAGRNMTYTIGIITALEKEYAAVKALLKDCKAEKKQGSGAGRRYIGGKISSISGGEHNVVLALADMGNNVAATRATLLLNHFPTIETVLMVGIAGGVPSPRKPEDHVRLGDVVISNKRGVVQYDMIKLKEIRACLIPPSAEMIESVRLLGAEALLGNQPWNTHIESSLRSIGSERPADTTDILFDSNNPEMKIEHPVDPKRTGGLPRIFLGPIASANELLKDPVKRDALRDHFGVKAVEMEGSGIADATWISGKGYLVIRGICDYCDIHKNDVWQEYASAVAAGYAVALIESMPSPFPLGADRIDPERPSPPKGISIPTPGIGTSTVTPVSGLSSSPPSVPSKNHHDFFREQIYKLFDGNDELAAVFAQAIFPKNQKSDKNSVAEHLVGNSGSTNAFPLRRFKRVLAKLVDERIELKKDSFQTLTLLTEILEIASYPLEDSQRIEKAMQEILSSDIGNPAIGSLSTSKIEDAKKLLIATRLKLLGAEFSDLSVAQLFNKNMMDNTDVRLLMRKIHVVTEPTLKSEDLTLIEFYSKACIDDLNYTQSSSSYQDDLQDVLEEKSEDSAVVCLLLSNEKTEAIKQLRKRFPLLLVIGLPKESIGLYKAIVRDLKDIDECLPLLCGTVKRIT